MSTLKLQILAAVANGATTPDAITEAVGEPWYVIEGPLLQLWETGHVQIVSPDKDVAITIRGAKFLEREHQTR